MIILFLEMVGGRGVRFLGKCYKKAYVGDFIG